MFSSYLSDDELSQLLRPLAAAPCLVLASGADEAVPQGVDGPGQGERLVRAIGRESNSATLRVLDGACHNLKGHETEAAEALAAFLANL